MIAQAIKVNNMVYTSGSIPIVPETGLCVIRENATFFFF